MIFQFEENDFLKVDEFYLSLALKEAEEAKNQGEVPIGAIVVSENKIIRKGYNMVEMLNDATAHAEMIAITSAMNYLGAKFLKNCTIYVNLEPCPMCAMALNWAQIGRIVYGASDSKKGYSLYQPSLIHPKTKITSGILGHECESLLKNFFLKLRD